MTNNLYVTRDNTTSGAGLWWCVWAVPGQSTFVGAEGYCSRKLFRTRRDASVDGKRKWGEIPTYWPDRLIEAPAPKVR